MLARRGHAVLSYDARGHGESGGRTNALGWNGTGDVAAAAAFLRSQRGVAAERVSALGLSMGAEVALRAAAAGVPLHAVVADGAGASTSGDKRLVDGGAAARAITWLAMRASELTSGVDEPPPLADVVRRIRVPALLIASRAGGEREFDAVLRSRMPRSSLWSVPDAGHTAALDVHPAPYERRVADVLDAR
jgi:pimeloyl-ACP methyl ester carboxylesterase